MSDHLNKCWLRNFVFPGWGKSTFQHRGKFPCLLQIIKHAAESGVALELNSNPQRLDLPDTWCRAAKDLGAKVIITTDAHSTDNLSFIRYGVETGRRGWLETRDVLNTLSLNKLNKALSRH